MMHFIEAYVQSMNPLNTPAVVGALIDLACDDDKIQQLLNTVGHLCPVDTLVEEVEKRNKLKMLRGWLDARINEGNRESATHDARAKIFILTNDERKEQFLIQNECYNSLVVGKFCESHDAYLAYVAYKRGKCHDQLIDVTNRHGLHKHQAKYLVEQQDNNLWGKVLSPSNEYRRQVIDEVVQSALPETKRADMVSSTVKAFMEANLPNELITLLEKIVLHGTEDEFRTNRNLQNLLLLTAIKADKDRVGEYIDQLDAFDAPEIAEIAIESELYEEAFSIYRKFKLNVKAIQVLVKYIKNLDRAVDFADASVSAPDSKEVYSTLGEAQLNAGQVVEAIESFMKAEDHNLFERVVESAKKVAALEPLSKYLKMCRKKARSDRIDSELLYTLAKLNKNAEIDEFIRNPNVARIQDVGEICFKERLYEAAKILFSHISNYAKLASTYVKLQQFSNAIDAARKANSVITWKEINRACVDAGDFRYDKVAGINVIIHPDELEETCNYYEVRGYTAELMSLLESGLGLESTSTRKELFTELAIIYSKYKPSKLMEHLKFWRKNINIPKVSQVCRNNRQWAEVVFLYELEPDFEKAARVMIEHSPEAWDEGRFPQIVSKVTHMELLYDSIKFYLEQHPDQINELLSSITARVDPAKVVERVGKLSHLPLIKRYLVSVQERNILQVNEALNDLYIEEEDFDALRLSIDTYDNFDSIVLARKLSQNDLVEFKRISAKLFRQNKKWKVSMDISKADKMYRDAMETAAISGEQEIAEGLLDYFVKEDLKHCFAACLYTCYDFIRPDYALELAWRHKIIDFSFPYILQVLREYTTKVDQLSIDIHKQSGKSEHVQHTPIPPGVIPLPPGVLPPGAVLPPGVLPPGALPPGAVLPPGALPPGAMPPGALPPGVLPPGHYPPVTVLSGTPVNLPPGTVLPPGAVPGGPIPGIGWRVNN
jgi:clathrin heavy chain